MRWMAVLLAGLVLVGCGGDDGADPASTATEPSTASDATEPSTADGTAAPTTSGAAEPETDEAAVANFERNVGYLNAGQFGRAYANIYPPQQELFDQALYERCAREGIGGIEVVDIEIVEVFQENTTVPGTDLTVGSTAITATFTLSMGGVEQEQTDTGYQIYVDGHWTGIAPQGEALAEGNCG